MLSDEDLAKLLLREAVGDADDPIGWDEIGEAYQAFYLRSARAVRAALTEPVDPMPLEGPDAGAVIFNAVNDEPLFFERAADGRHALIGTSGMQLPYDAAGVRALRTACQRFLAAQEGDDGAA